MSCTNHVPGAGDHLLAMHSVFELGPTCRNVLSCKRDTCQRSKVSLVVCLCRLSMPDIYPSSRWCPRGSIWASPCWTASADVPEPCSCPRRRLRDCGRAMVYLALTGVRPRGGGGKGGWCHSAPSSHWCNIALLLDHRNAALLDHLVPGSLRGGFGWQPALARGWPPFTQVTGLLAAFLAAGVDWRLSWFGMILGPRMIRMIICSWSSLEPGADLSVGSWLSVGFPCRCLHVRSNQQERLFL